jgi:hypothetical protein
MLVVPHIYRWIVLGKAYTTLLVTGPGATVKSYEEVYAYATQANRISHHQSINDAYVYEYRDTPSPFVSELVPSIILGLPGRLVSLATIWLIAKLMFPIVLVLLWFWVGRQAGFSYLTSLVAGFSTVLLPKLFALFPYPEIVSYVLDPHLEVQRMFHPLISSTIVAGTVLAVTMSIRSKLSWRSSLFSGLLLGLLFYTYFFAWTWVWAGLGLLSATLLVEKRWQLLSKLIPIIVVGLVIGAPYFINAVSFSKLTVSADFWSRTVLSETQSFKLTVLRYIFLATLVVVIDRQWFTNIRRRWLLTLLVSASLLPDLSQQMLGVSLEADHWIERFLYPLSSFVLITSASTWLSHRNSRWQQIFLTIMLLASMIRLGHSTVFQLQQPPQSYQLTDSRVLLYRWMEDHLPPGSVVGSLSFSEQIYLAAYTPYYPYIPKGDRTIASTDEIVKRYVFLAQQLRVPADFFSRVFLIPGEDYEKISGMSSMDRNAFSVLFGAKHHFDPPPYPAHWQMLKQAEALFAEPVSQTGKLDYLLVSPVDRVFSSERFITKCPLVYENIEYQLYRFSGCSAEI